MSDLKRRPVPRRMLNKPDGAFEDGYFESDQDFLVSNRFLAVALLEKHMDECGVDPLETRTAFLRRTRKRKT